MSPMLAVDLREMIRGTPFPLGLHAVADETIDVAGECDRWLETTAGWRAALVALGFKDEWAPKMEAVRQEWLARQQ